MGKINIFYGPQIDAEDVWICWDNHTCFLSSIAQIWIGEPDRGKGHMAKGADKEALNVELNSGSINSFLSGDRDFLVRAYNLLCTLTAEGGSKKKHTLDFENGTLEVYEEPKEEQPEEQQAGQPAEKAEEAPAPVLTGNALIMREIHELSEHLKKRGAAGTAAWQLLEEISGCYDGTCKKNLRDLYQIFIQLSLIGECNELGLNALLDELKNSIYRA